LQENRQKGACRFPEGKSRDLRICRVCGLAGLCREFIDAGARPALPLAGCAGDQGRLVEHVTAADWAAAMSAIVSTAVRSRDAALFI
jgi:hypothetical protein